MSHLKAGGVLLLMCSAVVAVTDDCGLVDGLDPLVAGGIEAAARQFPWHVAVYAWEAARRRQEQICGGSLVKPELVVTAAHCFDHLPERRRAVNVTVAAGKLHRALASPRDTTEQRADVNTILIPDSYDGSWTNYQDDIAVLILSRALLYNSFVRPICLDFEPRLDNLQLTPGNVGKVVGWGLTEENKPSRVLKVVELPYVNLTACRALSENRQYLTNDKICAGYTNGTAAVCRGDSGGGLVFTQREGGSGSGSGRERYYLRGVVSVALKPRDLERACNLDVAAMFTRVSAPQHQHFLQEIISDVDAHRKDACPAVQPNLVPSKSTWKSWNKCIEYQEQLVYPCVVSNSSSGASAGERTRLNHCKHDTSPVVYGELKEAEQGEFPFMVFLSDSDKIEQNQDWRYPGTILTERFILVSAWRATETPLKWARIRGYRARDASPPAEPRDVHEIARTITHPEYRRPALYHGIALLQTKSKMSLDRYSVPACLDTRRGVDYDRLLFTSWSDGALTKFYVESEPAGTCAGDYSAAELPRGVDETTMRCYTPHTCDSHYYGSPLVARNSEFGCMYTFVGVTLGAYKCDGAVLYTRVSHYVDWIEHIISWS